MDAVAPGVAERLHLLRLARDVLRPAVAHVAARRRPLEVRVESDAVGRVDVDALHLAAQALALRQRGHHLQAVAEDHAVRPVGVVLVEVRAVGALRQPVEVGEEVCLIHAFRDRVVLRRLVAPAAQVVDQHLGVHLLLDVERRRLNDEVGEILLVLAAPDELRVEVAVAARVGHLDGAAVVVLQRRAVLGGGDVGPLRLVVDERLDLLAPALLPGRHVRQSCPSASRSRARSCGISSGMSPLTISQTICSRMLP